MEQNISPVRFDETNFTQDDIAYLVRKELRIKITMGQARQEIGCELKEVRQWFADNHKRGFEAWAQARVGFTPRHIRNLIEEADYASVEGKSISLLETSPTAARQLRHAPDPQEAVDEAAIRKQIEGELTVRMTKQIAEYQRAEQIARDEMRSAQERSSALDRQLSYIKQQLEQVKSAPPKMIEKKVEVTPQHILDRQKNLEERLREISTQKAEVQRQAEQFKKQRDLYKRDLDNERQADNAVFSQSLEESGTQRIRANFAQAMHEIVVWSRASGMKLPSVLDMQTFGGEEWQRLDEALQASDLLGRELRKLKNIVSSPTTQQPFVIDSEIMAG